MTRLAVISIMAEDRSQSVKINELLSMYGEFIVARMGVPYEKKGINVISVVIDAEMNDISSLSGKIGALPGVSSKTIYSKK